MHVIFCWRPWPYLLEWHASWCQWEWQKAEQLPEDDGGLADSPDQQVLLDAYHLLLVVPEYHPQQVEMLQLVMPGCTVVPIVAGMLALFLCLYYMLMICGISPDNGCGEVVVLSGCLLKLPGVKLSKEQ